MNISHILEHTPVEEVLYISPAGERLEIFVKRDDLFVVPGTNQCGNKARVAWFLMQRALNEGYPGVFSDVRGANSPNSIRLAEIAKAVGIPLRLHAPKVKEGVSPQLLQAMEFGASVVVHPYGYATVLKRAMQDDPKIQGWFQLQFGLKSTEHEELSQRQVENLPFGQFQRLVVPVGSGMSLAGILLGLYKLGRLASTPVLGVWINGETQSAEMLLDERVPFWRAYVQVEGSGYKYGRRAKDYHLTPELQLDPYYEAKCMPFLRQGDLLWIVARNV
jgi:1-aminocyclopropane-1-carboxylate deaminase/D-cysteine desulfhydrase-like pyridoxal-dependent ACC family enzyme